MQQCSEGKRSNTEKHSEIHYIFFFILRSKTNSLDQALRYQYTETVKSRTLQVCIQIEHRITDHKRGNCKRHRSHDVGNLSLVPTQEHHFPNRTWQHQQSSNSHKKLHVSVGLAFRLDQQVASEEINRVNSGLRRMHSHMVQLELTSSVMLSLLKN